MIDPEILKAVQTVYSTDLSLPEEWTPERRNEFLTAEAEKISSMTASMAEELWEKAIAAWSRQRQGQTPNHATKVALLQAAREQAARTVLNNELYELIDRLWPAPEFSGPFRIKAGHLTSARAEDGLPPPAHPEDPLTTELAQMIYRHLRAHGLPER